MDRDRDPRGRARSARPRDGLGRPLPRGSVGVPTMPEDLELSASQALDLAQRLLDEGRPFHAHEVLESQWKATRDPRWQGLAQLAVGLTHAARGNEIGARRLIARGRGLLSSIPSVAAWADDWLAGDRDLALVLPRAVGGAP